jgi:hypothetical protein
MKKIYIYALLLSLVAAGCKKELTQNPSNAINAADAFKTEADFTNAVRGAYGAFRGASYYGGQDNGAMASSPDVMSDNLILNQQGRKSQQTLYLFKFQANNTWDVWSNAYSVILRTNFILENIGNLAEGDFKNNTQGEALAIRALAHFDLLRVYAKSYSSATDADPGVAYVTSTDPDQLPARVPVKQAYGLVEQDLLQAATLIEADNGVGRLNKAAVEALLSRLYLYEGQWQKVVDQASSAIADVPAANTLATTANFAGIWTDETEADVLFKIKIQDADNVTIGVGYEQAGPNGVIPEYSVDYAFFNLFADNDVRKDAYIGQTNYNGFDFNYVKKYFGRPTGAANDLDAKVIRMGEVYLNRAEAYYNLGNTTAARADLNTLRSHRYTGFVAGIESGTALYNAILLQRRLELAFEGARFFDLKRLDLPIQRSSFGDRADGNGVAATLKLVPAIYFNCQYRCLK